MTRSMVSYNTLTVSIAYTVTEAVTNSDNSISSNVHIDKNFGITITTSAAETVYCGFVQTFIYELIQACVRHRMLQIRYINNY